ncbi:cobaltochelatase subunit CobN, partial [Listeria monocytogenes]|nr:cobaltochelatase subunit CobN [Listeria monocytogenes]
VLQVTSVYRDQFDGFMRLLAEAIERLAALDEPGNPLARNSQALERRLRERGVEALGRRWPPAGAGHRAGGGTGASTGGRGAT